MRYYFAAFIVTVFFIVPWFAVNFPNELNQFSDSISGGLEDLAAVIVHNPKTIAGLQSTYHTVTPDGAPKIRVLIVPGHEPNFGGAEYGNIKEREMTVELAEYLKDFLEKNSHFQVYITRDHDKWNNIFDNYFKNNWHDIFVWEKSHKKAVTDLVRVGKMEQTTPLVIHTDVPEDVALRLYGVDKWSNENNIDIMIHIHINDYPRDFQNKPGKYNGFAIYIPERTYANSTTTSALALSVFNRLAKYNPVSNLPGEQGGIVPDQDLIAVGSYNSVDAASMLIEYGYIYEPQFSTPEVRSIALKDLAYQTFLGIEDFFDPTKATVMARAYDTLALPHTWPLSIRSKNTTTTPDIFALQTALIMDGVYPPPDSSLNECPRTGKIGPCTESAIKLYQKKNKIPNEVGLLGPKTLEFLNKTFGSQSI